MFERSLGGAGAVRRETLFLYTTKTPSFGRDIKISVFGIFKHFRTWNLAHLTVIDSTVSPDHADTLRVNLSYNRIDRFHISSLKQFERPVKGMKCGLAWTKVLSLYM